MQEVIGLHGIFQRLERARPKRSFLKNLSAFKIFFAVTFRGHLGVTITSLIMEVIPL